MQKLFSFDGKRVLYSLLMLGGMVLGFGKWLIFSWILQPAQFGVYSTIITTIAFLSYFGLCGLNEFIIKEGSKLAGRGDCDRVFAIRDDIMFIGILNTLLVIAVAMLLLHLTINMRFQSEQYFFISGILIVTVIFNVADASFRASLRSLPFAAMVFIRAAVLLAIGFILSKSHGLSGALLAELISAILALFFAFYIVGPAPRFSGFFLLAPRIIKYLKSGASFLGLQISRYFPFVLDKWLVGWFAGAAALGSYSFLLITFLAFIGLAGIYNAVIIPRVIARFGKNSNVKDLYDMTIHQAGIFLGASILFLPVYVGFTRLTVEYFLPKYNFDGLVLCVAAIYLGSVMHVAHSFFDSFFYSLDRQTELIIIAVSTLIVFIVLYLIVGILNPGILSFCIAFLIAKVILFFATFWRVLVSYKNISD